MNKFTNKDEEGRAIFQQYCNTKSWCKYTKASKDEYASWDVAYVSGTTNVIGEIKIREYASDSFEGWFLEQKKLDALQVVREAVNSKQKHSNPTAIQYINIFNDGQIMIWDITNLESTSDTINLQQTTMGNKVEVAKEVITLPTYEASVRELIQPIEIGNPNANPEDDVLPF